MERAARRPGPDAFLAQAAEWYALLQSGQASPAERDRWTAWLASGPEAQAAWARVETVTRRFSLPPDLRLPADAALDRGARRPLGRRQALKLLALGGAGGLAAWAAVPASPARRAWVAMSSDHHSAPGQIRELTLADGSRIWLDSDSAIDVNDGDDLRVLRVRRGDLLVQTAPDLRTPPRPFVVETAHGRLRALGTRFSVRTGADGATQLDVFEGRVAVRPAEAGGGEPVVDAGRQVRFDRHVVRSTATADPAREAWTRGVLLARDQPLAAFVQELGRYHPGLLTCDPAVAELRVIGGFPLHDTGRALAMLEAALPVRVRRRVSWWTAIGPA